MRVAALFLLLGALAAPVSGEGVEITASGAAAPVLQAARAAAAAELEEAGRLSAAAGKGPQKVSPRLFQLLERALNFCVWSEGAQGPLGGEIDRVWRAGEEGAIPPPDRLADAVRSAACEHLQLSRGASTAAVDAGSRLDLQPFADGWAVDRAVELLKEKGVATALLRAGNVARGFGPGPEGKGWRLVLPAVPGQEDPPAPVWLRDRALAAVVRPIRLFHQRTGQPASGALAVFAVTELAVDAQALAASSLVTGPREGQMRMGSIRPRPSLLWALGSGEGAPLWIEYLWSAVPKR